MDNKFSDKVFATADQAVGHGGEKVPILGYLIWYSIKESRIKIEDMRNLFAQIKIPTDFLPEEPSRINAFKRATTELSEEVEVKLDQNKTAVYMVRLTAKSDDEIVKSIIKEVRDAGDKRLSYEEIGRVHFDKDTEGVRYYDLQSDSQPIITQIKQMYETYCVYLTGKQIRVMIHEIIKSMSPTLVRPSGAVYFIPYVHADMVQKMEVLSKELGVFGITDFESAFESIPLIDADKTRALVEVRFEEQNTRDVDRTLVELSKLLQGTDTTTKTAARYVEQVRTSKEIITKYEGLLNKELSIARMKVEVLDQQVQKLVEKVAQQHLTTSEPEVKKGGASGSHVTIVVPHPEQAQVSTGVGTPSSAERVPLAAPSPDPCVPPAVVADAHEKATEQVLEQWTDSGNGQGTASAVGSPAAVSPVADIPAQVSPMAIVTKTDFESGETRTIEIPTDNLNLAAIVAPRFDQETFNTPARSQMMQNVRVDEASSVLVIPEQDLQAESDIEIQAEAAAQLESGNHDTQYHPVREAVSPAEFTTESLLA